MPPSTGPTAATQSLHPLRLQRRLRAAALRIGSLYETASFGSHVLAPDGTFEQINDVELAWLGSTRPSAIGRQTFREFLSSDSQLAWDRAVSNHGRHGFSGLELELRSRTGLVRLVSLSSTGRQAENGSLRPVRSVLFDLSRLQTTRDTQRIAAMAFGSKSGLYVTDRDGLFLRVNDSFTALTGYTFDEVKGQHVGLLAASITSHTTQAGLLYTTNHAGYWQGEMRARHRDGRSFTMWLSVAAVLDEQGAVSNYIGTFHDITVAKASQAEITRLAFHDGLTQLPNRRLLFQRVEHALAMAERNSAHNALLFIDLDHFKGINDSHGHPAGDHLLIEAGQRMQAGLREGDTVARVGGDEFVVLLEGLNAVEIDAASQARQIAEKLLIGLAKPYHFHNFEFRCTASIGINMVRPYESATQALSHADLAMYQAKKQGRNGVQFFDPVMQVSAAARADMVQALRVAIDQEAFELHYQPQVDQVGLVFGAEALLRWRHPQRGWIPAGELIALAEAADLIVPIGRWVLRSACRQLQRWAQHPGTRQLSLSINISSNEFLRDDFVNEVLQILKDTGANPSLLDLEITESMVMDLDQVLPKMLALNEAKLRFSIDDFGTGYSSLSVLTRLPISKLKIDQSFLRNLDTSPKNAVVVQTIISMAHSLKLDVIAEGVETPLQRDRLAAYGCTHYQGYLFGKPQVIADFDALVHSQTAKRRTNPT